MRGWGLERNAQLPMGGYAWAHALIDNALRSPGQQGDGSADGAQRRMIMRGWEQVEALREARAAMSAETALRFKRYVTKTTYRSRHGDTTALAHIYSSSQPSRK